MDLPYEELISRSRLLENDIRIMKSEISRLQHEQASMTEKLQDNLEKIKLNKQLPYLVANVVELLDVDPEGQEEGANVDLDSERRGKCAVIKTSTRTVNTSLINVFIDRLPSPDRSRRIGCS